MKKSLFLTLTCFVLFQTALIAAPKKTDALVLEDLAYFQEIFENAYVCYDEVNRTSPIKIDTKKMLKEYKQNLKWREKQGFNDTFENGINQEALVAPIWILMSSLNLNDGHLSIETNENTFSPSPKLWCYFSDYYFKKTGDDYFLTKAPDSNLIGKKYTGNKNNLHKTVLDNKELYNFTPLLFEAAESSELALDNKTYNVPIYENKRFRDDSVLKLLETPKTLYIRPSSFSYIGESDEDILFKKTLEDVEKKSKDKDYIILDLRGNHGGTRFYSNRLIKSIFANGIEEKNDLDGFLDKTENGKQELHSSVIARQELNKVINNGGTKEDIQFFENEYKEQLDIGKKYYTITGNLIPGSFPQYQKKTIDAKIIVLMDNYTGSRSEETIGILYMINMDNVILIGENSSGSLTYGGSLIYELPNSKVRITLCSTSNKKTAIIQFADHWHGDNQGFYPDYWTNEKNLLKTLQFITGDKDFSKILKEFDKNLL